MPRPSDPKVINKIRLVLKSNPNGLWVREIARKSGIPKSTVHYCLNKHMKNEIEDAVRIRGDLVRIVRLKK